MASRILDPAFEAEMLKQISRPCLLHTVDFNTGTRYFWSGKGDITYNGNTYVGGHILGVSTVSESGGLRIYNLSVTYAGENQSLISDALNGYQKNKLGTLSLAYLNNQHQIIGSKMLFEGHVDVITNRHQGTSTTLSISFESAFYSQAKKAPLYLDAQTQALFESGDLGFDYIPSLQEWRGNWGVV